LYKNGSIGDLSSGRNNSLNRDIQTNMLWEKKRLNQEKIEAFRERRLQKQIEMIEKQQEELKAKLE